MLISQTGAQMIEQERQRQIDHEGYSTEHDDKHDERELPLAAIAYILTAQDDARADEFWPWFKRELKPTGSEIGDLVKAGALVAAEIDRIIRTLE